MPNFAALIYEPKDVPREPTAPNFAEYMAGYMHFSQEAGEAITGGAALMPDTLSTQIQVDGGIDGDMVLTDGPYAETKEFLGGFFVLDAPDLDAAIAMARRIPAAWRDGGRIEVRPCMGMD